MEVEGVVEVKAFREARWGSEVGVSVSSRIKDAADLADLQEWLTTAVERLAEALRGGTP